MNSKLKGNLAMGISKVFSGFNENALRYLLPRWMDAFSGVVLRLGFGAVAFWIMGIFTRKQTVHTSVRQKFMLFAIGAVFIFGFMITLLMGLTYTTPISSSIFICLQPVWVFIFSMIFFREKATASKVVGILLGFAGALLCILTQKESDVATNPMLGNLFCLASSVLYAGYLIVSAKALKGIDKVTVSKWTFTGGAVVAVIVAFFTGFHAPVLMQKIWSVPMLVLLFVLIFPSWISYFLIDIGLKTLSTTVVALYGYLILIVATIVSYALGQDHFEWLQMVAMLMIISSVYFVEVAESKTAPNK